VRREPITSAEYRAFQQAYDFFNHELFDGSLPHVLVTLQRHANAKGYFSPERFTGRIEDSAVHELALNVKTGIRFLTFASIPSLLPRKDIPLFPHFSGLDSSLQTIVWSTYGRKLMN
jgi:hypothetical protein